MQLRPYQQDMSERIDEAWHDGAKNVCAVMPCGGGKTILFGTKLASTQGIRFAVAHRQELVTQMSLTIAKMGVEHCVIAQDSLLKYIIKSHIKNYGKNFHNPRATCIVVGVQTLINRAHRLPVDRAALWVIDECFPAGTLVDGKPIEQYKIGDLVWSFNEGTGVFEKQQIVRLFKKPMPNKMITINNQITCTLNHPFYTQRGWVEAGELTTNDLLLHRMQKRQIFEWERVENIQVYEQPIKNYVYNIEVYGNHTYIANNYVVHNCHHCLRSNIFGKVAKLFPSTARGLGVTATPNRADGRGIGKHADGIFDVMIEGPNMGWFIRNGYLTDYRIFGPYSNVDMSSVTVTSSGDYSRKKLTTAVRESKIVGDVVKSYLEFAPGKTGVVFVPDVQTGEDMAAAYIKAGVPAKCVHAKTPDIERHDAIQALKNGALKLLVNVDIFGEGFDLPAIEVVIMARPTESLPLYIQQFGRGLRIMEGKDKAIIIDHVHNIERHGLPDSPREWNLDSRERKTSKRDPNLIPIRTCRNCLAIYESWVKDCPYCGWVYEPMPMGSVEQVEGVITELDPAVLASMRGEIDRIDGPAPTVPGAPQAGINAQWRKRQEAQHALRDAMACWAGYQRAAWQTDDVIMRKFYAQYGIDVLSAQALGRKDAEELTIKLMEAVK